MRYRLAVRQRSVVRRRRMRFALLCLLGLLVSTAASVSPNIKYILVARNPRPRLNERRLT